jgi:hypothetical protein
MEKIKDNTNITNVAVASIMTIFRFHYTAEVNIPLSTSYTQFHVTKEPFSKLMDFVRGQGARRKKRGTYLGKRE